MSDLSWLNPTPHAIAVYASRPLSPVAAQHSLPSGRYSLLGPDFHRLDRTSLRLAHSFDPLPPAIELIRSGKVRALAVTTAVRSDALPDVSTVGEFVPGYETSGWNGIVAPRNTPIEIIQKLNTEINAGLADPGIKAKLTDLGGMVLAASAADFGKLIADEIDKWGKVIKFAGVKPD